MLVTMPLSRLPEMTEVAVAMFASELEGSFKEPPPNLFVFANLIDHLACERLLQDLPQVLRDMNNREAARKEVAREHSCAFRASSRHAVMGNALQQFVYMLSEVCVARCFEFYMCAPNLRVGQDDWQILPACGNAPNGVSTRS